MKLVARVSLVVALAHGAACVDWQQLTAPLPDADAGVTPDAGPSACDGEAPDEPIEPANLCGSLAPLDGDDWAPHPFLAGGDNEPTLGAHVDQLVIVDGDFVHQFCGEEEADGSPVLCPVGPRGQIDTAPDGALLLGASGGACVIGPNGCACAEVPERAEMSSVAVVTAETFVVLIQYTGADGALFPVLQERRLDDPAYVVGALTLGDVPPAPDPPVLTRLPRPCADPATWAVVAQFATSRRVFTFERASATGGLTALELPPYQEAEVIGVVAAPVGAAPGTSTTLMATRIDTLLELELRRGTVAHDGRVDGTSMRGGTVGYGDFLTGPCAARSDGRIACVGSPGLLVTDLADDPDFPKAVPSSVARFGDTTGAASTIDDAWLFGNDFVARTSLSSPQQPQTQRTGVVANLGSGERVVGATIGARRVFLGSFQGSAAVSFPDGIAPEVSPRSLSIDALAMGAAGLPDDGVLAWADRSSQQVSAVAIDEFGNVLGSVSTAVVAIDADFATVDAAYTSGIVSLWLGTVEPVDASTARLVLQACRATAVGSTLDLTCTNPGTVDLMVRAGPAQESAMTIAGDWLFFSGYGGVAAVELTASRDGTNRVATALLPIVNGVDPVAQGVASIARSLDCLYVAGIGRAVQPIELAIGQAVPLSPLPPLFDELETKAMLTLGDDSVLVGAEQGRLGRFVKDTSAPPCTNAAPAAPFSLSDGPVRPVGRLSGRPVFVGDALYVADEDARVWRVPLP